MAEISKDCLTIECMRFIFLLVNVLPPPMLNAVETRLLI